MVYQIKKSIQLCMLLMPEGKVDALAKCLEMATEEWTFPQNVLTVFSQTVFM